MRNMRWVGGFGVALALSGCALDSQDGEMVGQQSEALTPTRVAAQDGIAAYVRGDHISSVVYTPTTVVNGVIKTRMTELALVNGSWGRYDLSAAAHLSDAEEPLDYNIAAYVRADGLSSVVYKSSDNHVHEVRLTSNGWYNGDLTLATGRPSFAQNVPHGYARSDNYSSVIYAGMDNHIHELYLANGGIWQHGDLTNLSGAPLADGGWQAFGYVRNDGKNAVVFRAQNRHLWEISLRSTGWTAFDMTNSVSAVGALLSPHPYVRSDGYSAVVYIGTDNHIYELALSPGANGTWSKADLTNQAGAPLAYGDGGHDLTAYVRSDGVNAVVYTTSDGHIWELSLTSTAGPWRRGDLTKAAGAPQAGAAVSAYVRADGVNAVVFKSSAQHIHELSLPNGSSVWSDYDLTPGGS